MYFFNSSYLYTRMKYQRNFCLKKSVDIKRRRMQNTKPKFIWCPAFNFVVVPKNCTVYGSHNFLTWRLSASVGNRSQTLGCFRKSLTASGWTRLIIYSEYLLSFLYQFRKTYEVQIKGIFKEKKENDLISMQECSKMKIVIYYFSPFCILSELIGMLCSKLVSDLIIPYVTPYVSWLYTTIPLDNSSLVIPRL